MNSVALLSNPSVAPNFNGPGNSVQKKINGWRRIRELFQTALEFTPRKIPQKIIGHLLHMSVEIDSFSFSLKGPQKLTGIRMRNKDIRITMDEFQVDHNLFSLLYSAKKVFQIKNGILAFDLGELKTHHAAAVFSKGAITLREPLRVEMEPDQKIGEDLVKNIHPFLVEWIKLKNPLIVTVSPQNASCPLTPFSLKTLQIQEGKIEVGQIECRKGKLPALVTDLLRRGHSTEAHFIHAHCSPIFCSLEKGILRARRTDILLAHSIHVCTWGSIDFLKKEVDMQLGFPAPMLESWFHIRNLAPDYVLQIPIQGPMESLDLEKTQAAAKIASLFAKQYIPPGGVFGRVLEGAVNRCIPGEEEKAAPPPSSPFPWESN